MFSIAESMEKENTKRKRTNKVRKSTKDVPNKIRRFRLSPNLETAAILRRWFGSVRSQPRTNRVPTTYQEHGWVPPWNHMYHRWCMRTR
jgi:hypothetical protein